MKVGFIGGAVLLVLTLVFSYIAIKNNKMARQIAIQSFGLQPKNNPTLIATSKDTTIKKQDDNTTNALPTQKHITKSSQWVQFNNKFKNFNQKFKNF